MDNIYYNGVIGKPFAGKGFSHFSPEYHKASCQYEASKRNWEIELEHTGDFKVTNSDNHSNHVYYDGEIMNCDCAEFLEKEVGSCMHCEIVRHFRFEAKEGISLNKKRKIICIDFKDGEYHLVKKEPGKFEFITPADSRIGYEIAPGVMNFINTVKVKLGYNETDYENLNIIKDITLRNYQDPSIRKMLRCKKTVLTLKMGLGKTICAIVCIKKLKKAHNLIICPASLKRQWRKEIRKHAPELSIETIDSSRDIVRYDMDRRPDVTIINYELAAKDANFLTANWDTTIVDEIQRIRNKETNTWKALINLKSEYVFALSGTIIENRVDDLISIIEFLNPDELKPHWKFYSKFCKTSNIKVLGFNDERISELRERFDRYIVNPEIDYSQFNLPEKISHDIEVEWTSIEQQELHDDPYEKAQILLAKGQNYPLSFAEKRWLNGLLQRARLASNDERLQGGKGVGNKCNALAELLQELVINQDRKIVVFSEWIRMLELCEQELEALDIQYVMYNGEVSLKKRADNLDEFIENPDCKVFLSTETGGLGVDGLQFVADAVINMEQNYNPAKIDQRNGRVARALNPKKIVDCYMIYTKDGIEEKVQESALRKAGIREHFLGQPCL